MFGTVEEEEEPVRQMSDNLTVMLLRYTPLGAAEHKIPSEEDVRKEPGEGINMANAGGRPEKEMQYMLSHSTC